MFERFTERARRVIFFARYEASQFGSHTVETGYLLLGLIREDKNLIHRFMGQSASVEEIRSEIERRSAAGEKVSTSIDSPLSQECKRILAYAAEEAEALGHRHIGTEHLFLGMLRENKSVAGEILTGRGLSLEAIRENLSSGSDGKPAAGRVGEGTMHSDTQGALPKHGVVPDKTTAIRIAEAVWTAQYCTQPGDRVEATDSVLKQEVWIITGHRTRGTIHSVLVVFIQKVDGRILRIHLEQPAT